MSLGYLPLLLGLPVLISSAAAQTPLELPLDPPDRPMAVEPAFEELEFDLPVDLNSPPDDNRLFVVEHGGRIQLIKDTANPTKEPFLDITDRVRLDGESGLLTVAFHPNFAENGYFYVYYMTDDSTAAGTGIHDRVSRFSVNPNNPDRADSQSELIMINQYDEMRNHNGGTMRFGPDGYLYLSLGDEGDWNDTFNNSQRIDKDFFAGMIRIDVDQRPGNLQPNPHPAIRQGTYSIPADNPFVGATSHNGLSVDPDRVRTEWWATGLRNPWCWSFDPETGQIWLGDVGEGSIEEVNIITKGGNYGWNYREGRQEGPRPPGNPPPGFDPIDPVFQYRHSVGQSITGGVVYRGDRFAQMRGLYFFADFVEGIVWSAPVDNPGSAEIFDNVSSPSTFGYDPRNGDVLIASYSGLLNRIVLNESTGGTEFPEQLSETGAFTDTASMEVADTAIPYSVNLPFWSDGAEKSRWFFLPEGEKATYAYNGTWDYPEGTVWMKHFDLETQPGEPPLRLETRFLVAGSEGLYGLTYRWNEAQTDATLVDEAGETMPVSVETTDGETISWNWEFPSRGQCLTCHNPAAGGPLSFNTRQLAGIHGIDGEQVDQIQHLSSAGHIDNVPPMSGELPQHPALDDDSVPVQSRVNAYLAVNCAQCHRPGGSAPASFDARDEAELAALLDKLLNNPQGNNDNRVVAPGDPEHSMLLQRMSTRGPKQMPPIASNRADEAGAALIEDWIVSTDPQNPFGSEPYYGDGARVSDWFNAFNESDRPWIRHSEHEWLWITGTENNLWAYDWHLGWWWTSRIYYPFIYFYDSQDWRYYYPATREPRWFYSLSSGEWMSMQ